MGRMGSNGDQGEEMLFTHDSASGWSAWGTATCC